MAACQLVPDSGPIWLTDVSLVNLTDGALKLKKDYYRINVYYYRDKLVRETREEREIQTVTLSPGGPDSAGTLQSGTFKRVKRT